MAEKGRPPETIADTTAAQQRHLDKRPPTRGRHDRGSVSQAAAFEKLPSVEKVGHLQNTGTAAASTSRSGAKVNPFPQPQAAAKTASSKATQSSGKSSGAASSSGSSGKPSSS
eukprot:SAG31_NODE_22688_length_520_cov_0.817102_2_plen_112_part_01